MLAEAEYVRDPTRLLTLRERTREYQIVLTDRTTKLSLAQRRHIFEFGDKNGRLLAYLARPEYVSVYIKTVYDKQRVEVCDLADILQTFAQFYEEIYRSCASEETEVLETYLTDIDLPMVTEEDSAVLKADITVEKLEGAIASFAPQKSLGLDGFPLGMVSHLSLCFDASPVESV